MTHPAPAAPIWQDYLRASLLIIGAVGQMLFAFFPELAGLGETITSRSRASDTVLIPAGYAFVIWLPLYFGSIAFAVYHGLSRNLADPMLQRIGWYVTASYWANLVWAILTPALGPGWLSFILLELILLPLLFAIYHLRSAAALSRARQWALAPVYGLAGWLTVASPAGLSVAINFEQPNIWMQSAMTLALVILGIWAVLAVFATRFSRSWVYAGAVCWGLLAVALVNVAREEDILAVIAFTLFALIAISAYTSRRAAIQPA
ncbi:MAG: hypothetical protein AAFX04_03820 [Pseudomonadota bacterium]